MPVLSADFVAALQKQARNGVADFAVVFCGLFVHFHGNQILIMICYVSIVDCTMAHLSMT